MSKPRYRYRYGHVRYGHVRILAVVLAGAACLLASPANAGEYHVYSCRTPRGAVAQTSGWTGSTDGSFMYDPNSCAGGGSLTAELGGEVAHPANASDAGWIFSAPAGTQIAAARLWRSAYSRSWEPGNNSTVTWLAAPEDSYTSADVFDQCAAYGGCTEVGDPGAPMSSANLVEMPPGNANGATHIYMNAACGGSNGTSCPVVGAGYGVSISLYAADITLAENTPPTVSDISGPLVMGGTLSGQQAISFNAADSQSGVYGGSLVVDGKTLVSQILNTNEGHCQSLGVTDDGKRSFEYVQPCPPSLSASLTLNTNLLTAGQHSLELIVEDAAGNRDIAYNGTITTSGPPSIAVNGGSITGAGGGSVGAENGGSAGGALTAPTPAQIPNGVSPCAGEALSLTVNGKTKPPILPYGGTATVKGVLHCGTVPIRGARIAISTLGGPAGAAISTSVQSALDGSFSYKLPAGPDRTLRFSYTAFSNDPGPSATATAAIMISPRILLSIKPHHTSNRHTIYWTGTVTGGPYPQAGVTLDVEVREGRHWKIFDQVVANGKGRFRYSYRFHATEQPTTYALRVALPDTGAQGYPYTHGASNTVEVHVDP